MNARTTRREPFDEWLHRYQPLRGRARMWHFVKRFTGAIIGLTVAALILASGIALVLIVVGVAFVLFAGWIA